MRTTRPGTGEGLGARRNQSSSQGFEPSCVKSPRSRMALAAATAGLTAAAPVDAPPTLIRSAPG